MKCPRFSVLIVVLVCLQFAEARVLAAENVPQHRCASDALTRSEGLLEFHVPKSGHPFGFSKKAETLTPLQNPAAPHQDFDVLQVWGYVYKAKYRMRFLYARIKGSCVLMGQEILEYARL